MRTPSCSCSHLQPSGSGFKSNVQTASPWRYTRIQQQDFVLLSIPLASQIRAAAPLLRLDTTHRPLTTVERHVDGSCSHGRGSAERRASASQLWRPATTMSPAEHKGTPMTPESLTPQLLYHPTSLILYPTLSYYVATEFQHNLYTTLTLPIRSITERLL